MKSKLVFLLHLLIWFGVAESFGQAPSTISFQAVLRNTTNELITNTTVGVQIQVLQGGASGNVVYSEVHNSTTNSNGLLNLSIGGGSVQQGTFDGINWAQKPYFAKISLDVSGGTNFVHYSTTELQSVPYSFHAKEADKLTQPITGENGVNVTDNVIKLSDGTSVNNVKVWDGANWVNKNIAVQSSNTGNGAAISIRDPYAVMSYQIAIAGNYPERNGVEPFVGEVMLFAGNYQVDGFMLCNGQLLPVNTNSLLYAILGTSYGGNGINNFALPDLRGRSIVHQGQLSSGSHNYQVGEKGGAESVTITNNNLPSHNHTTTVTFTEP